MSSEMNHFYLIDDTPVVKHPVAAPEDNLHTVLKKLGTEDMDGYIGLQEWFHDDPLEMFPSISAEDIRGPLPHTANPKQAYGDKKIPVHFVPPAAVLYMGQAFKEGARKYGAYNWRENDVESMTYVGAALRHIMQFLDGEDIDPDTGEAEVPHIAAAMACLAILADATEGGNLIDTRPEAGPATKIIKEKQL